MRRFLLNVGRKWLGLQRLLHGPDSLLVGDKRFTPYPPLLLLLKMLVIIGMMVVIVKSLCCSFGERLYLVPQLSVVLVNFQSLQL